MNTKYNEKKRQKAMIATAIRAVVALCIGFIGFMIITAKETTMDMATSWTFGAIFILAFLGLGGYTVYRYITDMSAAKIQNKNSQPAHGTK